MQMLKDMRNILSLSGIRHIKGPRGINFVKLMFHFKRDSLGALEATEEQFGDIASYGWPINTVIIYCPKLIKQVLGDKNKIYVKGSQTDEMKIVMGNGLVTNNDRKSWLRSRVIVSKELGPAPITLFSKIIKELSVQMVQKWKANKSTDLDFSLEMRNITFSIAGKTLLGSDLTNEDARIVDEAVLFTSKMAHDHMFELFPLPYWVPTKRNKEFHFHNNNLSSIVSRLLAQEKKNSNEKDARSILQRLVYAKNPETGEGLSDRELRDEVITLLIAGYETTSNTLSWILGLLSKDKIIQDKLRIEILKKNEPIESINFKKTHPYLYQVILEGIRLYTAIPMSSRKNLEVDEFNGQKIPKNTSIVIPVWNIHRSEKYWEKPLTFNPSRFEGVEVNRLDHYLPFSKGERRCVGENFSLIEVAIIVSEILSNFELELIGVELPRAISHVSLKPKNGMPIRVKELSK
jgi:cytochrome P450